MGEKFFYISYCFFTSCVLFLWYKKAGLRGGSVGQVSNSWSRLKSGSQGREMEPQIGLCAQRESAWDSPLPLRSPSPCSGLCSLLQRKEKGNLDVNKKRGESWKSSGMGEVEGKPLFLLMKDAEGWSLITEPLVCSHTWHSPFFNQNPLQ